MHNVDIKKYFLDQSVIVNQALETYLPPEAEYPPEIHQALRYSVLNGGKRFRPVLAIATTELLNGNVENVLPGACAIELIHNYSLIHDDLPCMDNDDYRRGRLTCHKQFGEAAAILAGNALLAIAFEILSEFGLSGKIKDEQSLQVMAEIAQASGIEGMVAGQVSDMESEKKEIGPDRLAYIHSHKTGALIRASVRIGAIVSGANDEQMRLLTGYGEKIGLMFQVTDDILDIEGTQEKRGKKIGGDVELGKATYPRIHGMKRAKELVQELIEGCAADLAGFGEKGNTLRALADYVGNRGA